MKLKKSLMGLLMVALLCFSLVVVACGDEVAVPTFGPAATSTPLPTSQTAPTTTAQPSPATTSTTAPTSPATTTTPAASSSPTANDGKKATPEAMVNRLYTDIKAGDKQKGVALLFSTNLRDTLKGKNALESLYSLMGMSNSQKIDSFKVGPANISGDKATLTTTLTLSDGSSLSNNLTLVKTAVKDKNGTDHNLWQVDAIKVG